MLLLLSPTLRRLHGVEVLLSAELRHTAASAGRHGGSGAQDCQCAGRWFTTQSPRCCAAACLLEGLCNTAQAWARGARKAVAPFRRSRLCACPATARWHAATWLGCEPDCGLLQELAWWRLLP